MIFTPRQIALYVLSFVILLAVLFVARTNIQRVPLLKQIEFRNQTTNFISRLTLEMSEAEGCEPALGKQHLTPGQSQQIQMPRIKSGQEVEAGLLVENISLVTGQADMKLQTKEFTRPLTRHPASLRFQFRSSDHKIRVNWSKAEDGTDLGIKLYVWLDPTGKVVSCFSPNSAAAFCNSTNGFYWRQECRPTLKVFTPVATDIAKESGLGTCRYNGFQPKCDLGQTTQASCATGKCLPTQQLCQVCE